MSDPLHLEPCPCCGGRAVFGRITDLKDAGFGGNFITCHECIITTDLRFSLKEDARPRLAEAWNRREGIAAARSEGWDDAVKALREVWERERSRGFAFRDALDLADWLAAKKPEELK